MHAEPTHDGDSGSGVLKWLLCHCVVLRDKKHGEKRERIGYGRGSNADAMYEKKALMILSNVCIVGRETTGLPCVAKTPAGTHRQYHDVWAFRRC